MKKLLIAALMVVGMTTFAQEKVQREKLTPEQRNELQLKRLTLDLELNESQQKEMAKVIAEQSEKRKAELESIKQNRINNVKPTTEERFARQNKMLDEKIAMKQKVKKILSADQYAKWEKMNAEKKRELKDNIGERNRKGPRPEDK